MRPCHPGQPLGDKHWRHPCEKRDIPHWSPHQLRHNFGTRLRKGFGLEAAQLGLGHACADVKQIYAERDLGRILAIMEQVG